MCPIFSDSAQFHSKRFPHFQNVCIFQNYLFPNVFIWGCQGRKYPKSRSFHFFAQIVRLDSRSRACWCYDDGSLWLDKQLLHSGKSRKSTGRIQKSIVTSTLCCNVQIVRCCFIPKKKEKNNNMCKTNYRESWGLKVVYLMKKQ